MPKPVSKKDSLTARAERKVQEMSGGPLVKETVRLDVRHRDILVDHFKGLGLPKTTGMRMALMEYMISKGLI